MRSVNQLVRFLNPKGCVGETSTIFQDNISFLTMPDFMPKPAFPVNICCTTLYKSKSF